MKQFLLILLGSFIIFSCNNPTKKTDPSTTEKITSDVVAEQPDVSSDIIKEAPKNVNGIDVSSYQSDVDWNKVKSAGIDFVFVKATGGETYVDPLFHTHWEGLTKAQIKHGAYHFYYTKDDPVKQANFFIENVKSLSNQNNLPPVVDIETAGVNSEITPAQLQKDIHTFLNIVEQSFNRKPVIYTSYDFAQEYFHNADMGQYYLWLAEYQSSPPNVPAGWQNQGWTFWQNTSKGTVNGINGEVDLDLFNGDMQKLNSL